MKRQFFLFLLNFLFIYSLNANPIVQTSQGILNGTIKESRNGRKYSAFLGIPYAQPPTGNLRFKNPVPAGNWNGTRQADSFGNICSQSEKGKIIGNEDCLFLNVYSPIFDFKSSTINNITNDTLLPVMVWIHGGAFVGGNGNKYGAEYILDKDVILVTMNYRLGIFGFLSTGDSAAPGNFGMKDQVLALKWVQQNIKSFGGDPNQVTIFGESAGGVSVALHAISKASDGLFQQYIIQSGANLSPWAYQKKSHYVVYVREIAALVLCPFISSANLLKCLRKRSVESLINTSSVFGTIARFAQLTWTPTDEPDSEDAFLTDNPKNLIEKNQTKDLPFMSGVNSDEGILISSALYGNDILYGFVKLNLDGLVAYATDYYLDSSSVIRFTRAVNEFYFNNTIISAKKNEFLGSLTRFLSDGFFFYPQLEMLEKVTPKIKSSNYFYSFGYRGAINLYSKNSSQNIGVGHAEELMYLFNMDDNPPGKTFSATDIKVSKIMVDLWSSFAINGKPTSEGLIESDLWKPYNVENTTHLQIGNINNNTDPLVSLSNNFYPNRMDFWQQNAPII